MSTDVDDAIFAQELRKLSYDRRWTLLKPKLKGLFRSTEVEHICRILKERWAFAATPTQCKYRFKSWGWKKSIPETVKRDIRAKALKRAAQGKDTITLYNGLPVLPGRLQRTNKITINPQSSISAMLSLPTDKYDIVGGYVPFGNSLLLNWRLPYGSHPTDPALVWNQYSPASPVQTPTDVEIRTPGRIDRSPSPIALYAPFGESLMPVVKHQRSMMLHQGRLPELLTTLSQREQMTFSTWLYQRWYSAFVAAQFWGKSHVQEPHDVLDHEQCSPSQECRWAIHVFPETYEKFFGHKKFFGHNYDTNNANDESGQCFASHLGKQLQSNHFSGIPEDHLPLPVPEITRQSKQDPSDWVLESVALAIMGRNSSLLRATLKTAKLQKVDIASIYPFHMAAAFLDGGRQCCKIFDPLCALFEDAAVAKEQFTNEYGHTVLDSFLLTILRSHSTVSMRDVDGTLNLSATMPGQEVDICGRWSADSPCFQNLVASGKTVIPASWKHKFCHTSIQAVIHSTNMLLRYSPTMLGLHSGHFKHTCHSCGLRLQLRPLHALVMTAFHLVTSGRAGEDLFGIVAYYLCLVAYGVSPLTECEISASQLLHASSEDACDHELLTPHETAMAVQGELRRHDLPDCLWTGWAVFTRIMQITEDSRTASEVARNNADENHHHSDGEKESGTTNADLNVLTSTCAGHEIEVRENGKLLCQQYTRDCHGWECDHLYLPDVVLPYFGESPILGHIWAAIRAELADHRKIDEKDGWLSESFSMKALLQSLQRDVTPDIGYVRDHMLKPYCRCGNFQDDFVGMRFHEEIFQESCGYRLLGSGLHKATFLLDESEWVLQSKGGG